MFDKMVKMKSRKGFTLLEMIVVIAIVALLVSIILPIVSDSTVKSRAATNAANLRSMEAQLATLKVTRPECFDSANHPLGYVRAVNGTLTFTGGLLAEPLVVTDVPTAEDVEVDVGMDVTEGTQMTIFLEGNEIIATYDSLDGAYDKDDFAEVAATGKYTGTGRDSAGSDIGEVQDKLCEGGVHLGEFTNLNNGKHTCKNCKDTVSCYDYVGGGETGLLPDGKCDACGYGCMHSYSNGICKYCQGEDPDNAHVCADNGSYKVPVVGTVAGNPDGKCDDCGAHVHVVETIDGIQKCKWSDCGLTKCEIEEVAHSYSNAVCTNCGYPEAHDCEDTDSDHKCNKCGEPTSTCEATAENKYQCSICGCACPGYEKSNKYDFINASKCKNCDHYYTADCHS